MNDPCDNPLFCVYLNLLHRLARRGVKLGGHHLPVYYSRETDGSTFSGDDIAERPIIMASLPDLIAEAQAALDRTNEPKPCQNHIPQ